jgi:para-nitrobenzyl esterase
MAMPKAKGLFHRVATHSGSRSRRAVREPRPACAGAAEGARLDRSAGRSAAHAADGADRQGQPRAGLPRPVKDGRSLPRDPFDPDAPPQSAHIPMILGNTKGETRTLIGRGDPSLFSLTWETLKSKLEANSPFMGSLDRGDVIAKYREWHPEYSPAGRVLCRDHRFEVVARAGDRGRSSRRTACRRRADVCLPV